MMKQIILFVMVLLYALSCNAQVASYVVDNAAVFTPEQKVQLEQELSVLEQETNGLQFVIFTETHVPEGMVLEERSLFLAEQSGIGRSETDNGVLFYLATEDKQYRWEVGYGVEDVLNTPFLGRMSRDEMVPFFQEGDYAGGVLRGVTIVKQKLLESGDSDVVGSQMVKDVGPSRKVIFVIIVLVFILIVIIALIPRLRRTRSCGMLNDKVYIDAASFLFSAAFKESGKFGGGGSFGGGGFSGGW